MTDKVALVVVHGVADQLPLETARSVIDLLLASAPAHATYAARGAESIRLPVDPLEPRNAPRTAHSATPLAKDRSTVKAIAQSWRSDFQREGWAAPDSRREVMQAVRRRGSTGASPALSPGADAGAPGLPEPDRGIQISNFLLSKHISNGARRESHATERVRLDRDSADGALRIDVFEFYWADLSRLASALPRIVTEIFTLMFRLSKLGRETMEEARRAMLLRSGEQQLPRWNRLAWRSCGSLQNGLDWLFVNGFAMLMQQLGLLGLVLLGLGALQRLVPAEQLALVHRGAAAVIALAALGFAAYHWHGASWRARARPLAVLALGGWLVMAEPPWIAWASVLIILGIATAANEAGLRIADERFPLVRPVGRALWAVLCVLLVASVAQQIRHGAPPGDLASWLRATLHGVEITLQATKLSWIVAGALLVAWYLSGIVAGWRRDYEARASIASGRLGLGLSIGAFLATSMAIWAMLSAGLGQAVETTRFAPCLFMPAAPVAAASASAAPPAAVLVLPARPPVPQSDDACLFTTDAVDEARIAGTAPPADARPYLDERYRMTTASFALLAVVLLLLLAYLVTMFVPSVLAEMKLLLHQSKDAASARAAARGSGSKSAAAQARADRDRRTRRLGRWLTAGFRHLDRAVALVIGAGVVLGALVALAFLGHQPLADLSRGLPALSDALLQPMVITAASIVAVLVAFGRLLSQHLPALRGPLDIALDVDNHFREFPRTGIPRARIFSRYAALLREIAAGDYDRVVIVAHSQGSVISTELLRYLCSDGLHAPPAGARPQLGGRALPPIRLLTLGCPLRQLYAARFPTLYRWILRRHGDGSVSGPRAADIGAQRWINAFCSGDYVGRWLWSQHRGPVHDALGHPMVDATDPSRFGRADAYAGFDPMPPMAQPFAQASEVEVCLGLGAHTHYFEAEQHTVAWLIDHLLASDGAATAAAG